MSIRLGQGLSSDHWRPSRKSAFAITISFLIIAVTATFPDFPAAVVLATKAGIDQLIVIPYFLTVGLHLRRDMPKLIAAAQEKHPNIKITVGQSLENHPLMPSLIVSRVKEVFPD